MPRSTPRRRKGHGAIMPPLSKVERITELLQIQVETFPQKELTPAEIERWIQDLSGYPVEAIKYAFEEHRQMAVFFPVPAQILEICKTWEAPEGDTKWYRCNDECKARHGKGYGENDVLHLWNTYTAKRAQLNRQLTNSEVNLLLDDLDKKRGQCPAWRA